VHRPVVVVLLSREDVDLLASSRLMELPRLAAATRAFWTVASSSWTVMFRFMLTPHHVIHV